MAANKSLRFLQIFVFINGASITALEIVASRVLAPYFGASLPVWGSIIGVTMIALAIGYTLGGKIADRRPKLAFLGFLTLIAGIIASLIPLIAKPLLALLLNNLISYELIVIVGSLFGASLLFALPIVIMGMVSPYAVKIASLKDAHRIGDIAGSLYSLATIGSILGVFLPSFVLVPLFGSNATIVFFAFLEILISLIALSRLSLIPILLLPLSGLFVNQKVYAGSLVEVESLYQYIRLVKKGKITSLIFNEGLGTQSIYDSSRILKLNRYWDYGIILPYFQPDKKEQKMTIIGAAGATIATNIRDNVKDIDVLITGLEIDPEVVELAKKYFDADSEALNYRITDGRLGLRQINSKQDIIYIDAYSQAHYIPPHLATKEFFLETKEKLTDQGVVVANINALSSDSPIMQSIATTINSVYPYVWYFHVPETYNYLIVGSNNKSTFEKFKPAPEFADFYRSVMASLTVYDQKDLVLTDDRAPLELMTDWEIYRALKH